MDRQTISQRTGEIQKDVDSLSLHLRAIDALDIGRFPNNYARMLTQAALLGEKLTCRLRSLIYASLTVPSQIYLEQAARVFEVGVFYDGTVFSLTIPCLLPKKSGRHTAVYLFQPVNAALSRYAMNHEMPKFQHCCICIIHEYRLPPSGIRVFDYDNLEQKQLLDTLAAHILTDDCATLCDVFHTAKVAQRDATSVFVMPKPTFPGWAAELLSDKFPPSDFPAPGVR